MALHAVQAARYVVPLALVPFLARVLRPTAFGELAFSQSLAFLFWVLLDFGFGFSATRTVARERDSQASMRQIVASMLGAKLLLAGVVATLALGLWPSIPQFRSQPAFLLGACLLAMGRAASPVWYFQGVERMALQSAIDVAGTSAGAAVVFAVVRRPQQAAWVLYLLGAGALIGALVNHVRMCRRVGFSSPGLRASANMLHQGLGLFIMRASVSLYTNTNVFLLGLFVPAGAVADFAGAEKVVRASLTLFDPGMQAAFPRMTSLFTQDRQRGMRWAWLLLAVFTGVAALTGLFLALAAPWIVRVVLGPGYGPAATLLRWLAVLLPVVVAGSVLGTQILIPLGLERVITTVLVSVGLGNLLAVVVLVPRFGARGMAWCALGSEGVITLVTSALVLLRRRKWSHATAPEGQRTLR